MRHRANRRQYVVVVGSANMDLVITTERVPARGETVSGTSFCTFPGGKGANQAVGIAKLGGECFLLSRVGDDAFGDSLVESLTRERVRTDLVDRVSNVSTGIAVILVETGGDNRIVTVRGANDRVRPSDVDAAAEVIALAGALLVQLEIPLDAVTRAVEVAHGSGVPVILDPAPVSPGSIPDSLLAMVDVLTPNQVEASVLTGLPSIESQSDAALAGRRLVEMGVGAAIVKLGAGGAVLTARGGESVSVPGHRVRVVDTTAAGDTFAAAFAVRLVEGSALEDALLFANAAAALSVQRQGAQSSIPSRDEVEAYLSSLRSGSEFSE